MKRNKIFKSFDAFQKNSLLALSLCIASPSFAFTDTSNSNAFDPSIDFLQINDDVLGDPDGLMTKVADKMFLNSIGYQDAFLVIGTYSSKLNQRFDDAGEGDILGLMNTLYPNSQCTGIDNDCGQGKGKWLNAHETWALQSDAPAVEQVALLWKETLDSNPEAEVWIAEGGQGDFTLDVAKYAHNILGVSLASLNNRVHTVQHSQWNIDMSTEGVYGFNDPARSGLIGRQGSERWLGPVSQRGEIFDYVQVHYIQSGNGNSGLALRNDPDFLLEQFEPALSTPYDSYWATMKESTGKDIDIADFSDNIETQWIFDQYESFFNYADANFSKAQRPLAFIELFGEAITNSNLRPTGQFISPTPTNNLLAGDSMNIAVSAQDSDGSIAQVELSVNGTVISSDSDAPYAWDAETYSALANLTPGSYALESVITDNDGAQRTITQSVMVVSTTINNDGAPTGNFIAPTPTDIINSSDDVFVTVDASDANGSVDNVVLFVNGTLVRRERSAPYEWNSTRDAILARLPVGNNAISAVITDNEGNTTTVNNTITVNGSDDVNVDVNVGVDNTVNVAPAASFINPTPDSVLNAGDSITVAVEAFDTDGGIRRVVLRINNVRISVDREFPYVFSSDEFSELANLSAGNYRVRVTAFDNDGERTVITRRLTVQ